MHGLDSTPVYDPAAIIVGIALGAIALTTSWAFMTGRYRRPARQYWDSRLPWYIRNIPFGLAPLGAMFLIGSALPLAAMLGEPWGPFAGALLLVGVTGGFLLALRWMSRPPRQLKPNWLRQEEVLRAPTTAPFAALRVFDRVFVGILVVCSVLAIGIFLFAAVVTLLGLSESTAVISSVAI